MSNSNTSEDIPSEEHRPHREYVDSRYTQLSELERSSSDSAYHYLFNINAGAAVAVLTFIGTSEKIAKLSESHRALGAFVLGVLMCGAFRAVHIHWASSLFETWRRNYDTFERGCMEWHEVTRDDDKHSRTPKLLYIFGYAAWFCFIAGCLFASSILAELKEKEAALPKESAAVESVSTKEP